MNSKKGVSLIVLVIAIVVMGIIASTVMFVSSDTVDSSDKAAFITDLQQIEDLVHEYYLSNNMLPIVEGIEYTKNEVVTQLSEGSDSLSGEVTLNGDDEAIFYELDLTKLPIDSVNKGMRKDENALDVFLITSDSLNVYYLQGVEISDEYYFSLSENLTDKKKINSDESIDTSNITITNTTSAINLTKSESEWTNELSVTVKTTLSTGETLKYFLGSQDITEKISGLNIDMVTLLNSDATLKTNFYANSANQILKVQKYKNETVVAESQINVSNLDILIGNAITQENVQYTLYDNYVLANIAYNDLGGSGVKEARVLYTTKYDESNNVVPYYTNLPAEVTKEYVYSSGKSFAANLLKLPTDVLSYVVVFIDNAGNISDLNTFTVSK